MKHHLTRLLATALTAASLFSADLPAAAYAPASRTFSFTVLNITGANRGGGLAIVMRTPSGKTWLYDTGIGFPDKPSSDGGAPNYNSGRDLVAPYLRKLGVTTIDGVFISHAHNDHFGGLPWLMDHFEIKQLIDSGYEYRSDNPADYRGALKSELERYNGMRGQFKARGAYLRGLAGDTLALDPDLKIEVIAPSKTYFRDPKVTTRAKSDSPSHFLVNANSLMLRIQFGDIVFLLPGDIQVEDILLSLLPSVDPGRLKCHVLVCPGHGIAPLPQAFANAAHPEVSIASTPERTASRVLSTRTLKALGTGTYITGLNGNVEVLTDGKKYEVKAEREPVAE